MNTHRIILAIAGLTLVWPAEGKAADGAQEAPYALPPFEVNEVPEGLPWKYVRWGDYEMISLCSREMSLRQLASLRRGQMLLPSVFQPTRSSFPAAIMIDSSLIKGPTVSAKDMVVKRGSPSPRLGDSNGFVKFSGGIRAYDGDSLVVTTRYLPGTPVALISYGFAEAVFSECRPAPRAWLSEGIFGSAGLYMVTGNSSEKDEMRFASLLWLDEPTTEAIRHDSRLVPELLPLERFFNDPPPDQAADAKGFALWQSQARLFVHWALLAKKKPAFEASAFWQFANDSRLGAVSEEKFRSYFGRDYATALAELRAYLPVAVKNGVDRAVPGLHEAATKTEFVYRAATESEVARIKGNFERMEAKRLRQEAPDLAERYEAAARRSLNRGLHFMGGDIRLRGVLGLLEYETGHPVEARRQLEIAYASADLGTRALLALAQLRLDEVRTGLPAGGQLSAPALERVLGPLFAARERQPAVVETYRLIAEVWAQSAVTPTRGHLAVLQEGVRFFPWDEELRDKTRALHRQFGYEDEPAAAASGERQ